MKHPARLRSPFLQFSVNVMCALGVLLFIAACGALNQNQSDVESAQPSVQKSPPISLQGRFESRAGEQPKCVATIKCWGLLIGSGYQCSVSVNRIAGWATNTESFEGRLDMYSATTLQISSQQFGLDTDLAATENLSASVTRLGQAVKVIVTRERIAGPSRGRRKTIECTGMR